jgi:hypothetical protein
MTERPCRAVLRCASVSLPTRLTVPVRWDQQGIGIPDPDRGLGARERLQRLPSVTDEAGTLVARNLPFVMYRVDVKRSGSALYSRVVESSVSDFKSNCESNYQGDYTTHLGWHTLRGCW